MQHTARHPRSPGLLFPRHMHCRLDSVMMLWVPDCSAWSPLPHLRAHVVQCSDTRDRPLLVAVNGQAKVPQFQFA